GSSRSRDRSIGGARFRWDLACRALPNTLGLRSTRSLRRNVRGHLPAAWERWPRDDRQPAVRSDSEGGSRQNLLRLLAIRVEPELFEDPEAVVACIQRPRDQDLERFHAITVKGEGGEELDDLAHLEVPGARSPGQDADLLGPAGLTGDGLADLTELMVAHRPQSPVVSPPVPIRTLIPIPIVVPVCAGQLLPELGEAPAHVVDVGLVLALDL